MFLFRRSALALVLAGGSVLVPAAARPAPAPVQDPPPASIEYKLLVAAERAVLRAAPDAASAALIVLAKGAILSSFEQSASGDWYRVVADLGEGGVVLVGYLPAADVRIVGQKVRDPVSFWAVLDREFRGMGLSVRVSAGRAGMPAGDMGLAAASMLESTTDRMTARGYIPVDAARDFRLDGFELGLDLYFKVSSRFEIAAGLGYYEEDSRSWVAFGGVGEMNSARVTMQNILRIVPLRLGAVYRRPLVRNVSAYAEAGAFLPLVKYASTTQIQAGRWLEEAGETVTARRLGAFAALGLELALTSRGSLFLEARGRTARLTRFDGAEIVNFWMSPFMPELARRDGRLYFGGAEGERPRLTVLEESPEGTAGFRPFEFPLRAFGLSTGLRLKF